ncbi:MAG: TolB family protein [Candidatus Dormibacteria bacterium]
MRRVLPVAALLGLMALFGLVVYAVLGTLKTNPNHSQKPTQSQALIDLPGNVYVVQDGSIYRLSSLHFVKLAAPAYDWVQVEQAPGGDLLAVDLSPAYSDVYLLSTQGTVIRQLLQESSNQYFQNHWAFYPQVSPNGQTLFYAFDWVDPGSAYNVDFQIQSVPFSDPGANPEVWSEDNLYYQGGDVEPIPLASGAVIYAKYAVDQNTGATYSQLALAASPGAVPTFLTTPQQDCAEPALSPAGTELAMICTNNSEQTTSLQVASWNGTTLGTPVVLCTGPEPASPAWAPDGKSLLYVNTVATNKASHFQLWWLPKATAKKPGQPELVTQDLNFTATSPAVWTS